MQTLIERVTFIMKGITMAAPPDYETDLISSFNTSSGTTFSDFVKQLRGGQAVLPFKTNPYQPTSDSEKEIVMPARQI
ncbi:hypothetical protein [Chryseobacterium balustinum]|uniref:Uncharacterized protein n=1 Tax=Chryseobacterium balustinum TaxID=246 RepID=A0AAX2IT37_9FLAO|nr:hypothetical protein [Chryseobacterium balustinum]AZB29470.1 hypothetical protein EB354_09495 [Chryseobacterium balustinum]SKB74762.1 hypothetical protein SAMN05421800_107121 [Chryseobacterium balustinum]SQA92113.1 Uncharacterised protein [Chryseobacterium balustinum]